jgi:cell wall-associated NlpC family hydrolase
MQRRGQSNGPLRVILAVALALALPTACTQADAQVSGSEVVVRALALVDAPYRYGGRTPSGFDCSGYVGYVFSESVGLSLPRRAEEMGRVGEKLDRSDLAPGDLVFFNTLGRRFSHVGIYVGDGQFVHAPARRGRVRIERLDEPYWRARYNGARRIEGIGPAQVASTVASQVFGPASEAATELRITH